MYFGEVLRKVHIDSIMVTESKICKKCGESKSLDLFAKNKTMKDGCKTLCKQCFNAQMREYNSLHRDKKQKRDKIYSDTHKEEAAIYNKKWRKNNPDYEKSPHILKRKREYRKTTKRKEYLRTYYRGIRRENVNYKIAANIRGRIKAGLKAKRANRNLRTPEYLGCSFKYLRHYIESQFTEGMSWDNYGVHGWHIDHIIPCASFDLTDIEQQKQCFHYTNLQPLWAKDNLSKGARILAA